MTITIWSIIWKYATESKVTDLKYQVLLKINLLTMKV